MDSVKLAICRLSPDGGRARAAASPEDLAPAEVSWLKFGEDVVFCGADEPLSRFAQSAARAGIALREHPDPVARERLHVVVQKGRLFQREHPEVPVLLDKGRFLLVAIDPQRARDIGETDVPCYALRRLEALDTRGAGRGNRIVFDARRAADPAAATTVDPLVQQVVSRIARPSFEQDLTRLAELPTRYSTSSHYAAACDFVEQRLAGMGYATAREAIVVDHAPSQNVIARRDGAGPAPRGLCLVTAHLDSINLEGGAAAPAPGADDDGSGSAGVLEIARALQDHRTAGDVQFVLFGGEEEGLFGSKRFAASMPAPDRARVRAVVHMDMIGSLNSASPAVLLEGAALSQGVIDGLRAAAATYTGLAVQISLNPFNSDHVSFLRQGVPAVLTIEGTDGANETIHSARDTLDRINFDLALDILRMNAAFVTEAPGRA
jgi:hypothetical protein